MVCASNDGLCLSSELFLSITIVMLGARAGGLLFRAFKQPSVLGEIVAGIVLGPSVLGQIPGNIPKILFPADVRIFLNVCAQLGLIIFMFVVGLEVDIPGLTSSSTAAILIGGMSVIVPFLIGTFVLSPFLYDKYKVNVCVPNSDNQTAGGQTCSPGASAAAFDLFLGVALSVTAFPVLARIITDYKMIRLPTGVLVMACAALNDLVAWVLMAVCLAVKQATGGYTVVIQMVFALVGYFIALTHVLNPILRIMVVRQYRQSGSVGPGTMAFVLMNLLVASWFLHYLGFHAMLGAFMFGLAFPRSQDSGIFHLLLEKLETVSVLMLLPCFFLVTGLSIDLSKLGAKGGLDLLYICIVAVSGKTLGAGITAYFLKMKPRKCLTIAVLMNTRGLAEIVILNIGLQQNIINQDLFTIMVVMAVVTTIMAGPLLRIIYPTSLLDKDLLELEENLLKRSDDKARQDAAILLAVVHDVSQAYNIVTAGLESLQAKFADNALETSFGQTGGGLAVRKGSTVDFNSKSSSKKPVQLVLLHFTERNGEIGTGLQETVTEVEQRHALEKCMTMFENEGKIREGGMVIQRLKGLNGMNVNIKTRNIVKALLPNLMVVDWPNEAVDQEILKQTILTSTCPILLYSGKSSEAFTPDPKSTTAARLSSAWSRRATTTRSLPIQDEEPDRVPRCLRWLLEPIFAQAAALHEAIDEEFGGVSLACCLGRSTAAKADETASKDAGADVVDNQQPDAKDRLNNLRNNADNLLNPNAMAATSSDGAAAAKHAGMVTIMISGLGRESSTLERSPSAASVEVDDIFRTLVHKPPRATPKLEPVNSRRSRMFAPILINPAHPHVENAGGTVSPLSSPTRPGGFEAPLVPPLELSAREGVASFDYESMREAQTKIGATSGRAPSG